MTQKVTRRERQGEGEGGREGGEGGGGESEGGGADEVVGRGGEKGIEGID